MELNELIKNVQQWSIDRGLDKVDSKKQLLKLYEEFGELASGIAKNKPEVIMDSIGDCVVVLIILAQQQGVKLDNIRHDFIFARDDYMLQIAEEIGSLSIKLRKLRYFETFGKANIESIIGRLIRVAETNNVKFEDCLEMAWNAIKDRKGKLVDGVWVKEEDLPDGESLKEAAEKDFLQRVVLPELTSDDVVNNPGHYRGRNGLEAMEVVREFAACPEYVEGFHWGNAMKYMMRYHKKNGVEDLKKARKNLDWLIEELEK